MAWLTFRLPIMGWWSQHGCGRGFVHPVMLVTQPQGSFFMLPYSTMLAQYQHMRVKVSGPCPEASCPCTACSSLELSHWLLDDAGVFSGHVLQRLHETVAACSCC
jgi:hypothetical protein